jgi:predicted DNA-binding WGR domain protein
MSTHPTVGSSKRKISVEHTCEVLQTDGDVWDVELNQRDLSKNMDKFYTMQILVTRAAGPKKCYLFLHWGRTGTTGQTKVKMYAWSKVAQAKAAFTDKYFSKTGCAWSTRSVLNNKQVNNKYINVPKQYHRARPTHIKWEYELIADPFGKPDDWYPYEGKVYTVDSANSNMEDYYAQYQSMNCLNIRFVKSDNYVYRVDFDSMTQQNVTSKKVRNIRRNQ